MSDLVYLYLAILIILWLLGYFHTGKFVRPKWKIPGKFVFYVGVSTVLAHFLGHFGLIFIVGHPAIGLIFHTKVCKENNINLLTCEPRQKYLELQEKWAKGDFAKAKD